MPHALYRKDDEHDDADRFPQHDPFKGLGEDVSAREKRQEHGVKDIRQVKKLFSVVFKLIPLRKGREKRMNFGHEKQIYYRIRHDG